MWGFARLLALETFKDPSNGYLVHDTCVFGAEVLVIKHTSNWEYFSFVNAPDISNATFTWKIENFTYLNQAYYDSEIFTIGERDWYDFSCNLLFLIRDSGMFKNKKMTLVTQMKDIV